jgi:hypothetical protein
MANELTRDGYGQVEPNHLSAQRTGQIFAQLAADSAISQLENGQFAKYDYEANKVDFTGDGEWLMVFNEVKLYEAQWRQSYKDYVMKKSDAVSGTMVPRLFKTNVGDIYTTNCVKPDTAGVAVVGAQLQVGADGFLTIPTTPDAVAPTFNVVKVTTMPDGQPAVKLQRIK